MRQQCEISIAEINQSRVHVTSNNHPATDIITCNGRLFEARDLNSPLIIPRASDLEFVVLEGESCAHAVRRLANHCKWRVLNVESALTSEGYENS